MNLVLQIDIARILDLDQCLEDPPHRLAGALHNAGVNVTQLYVSGYDQAVLSSPASMSALEGAYITTGYLQSLD